MHNEIYTLQEFFTHTENYTYVVAGLFLLSFPFFWKFLTANERD